MSGGIMSDPIFNVGMGILSANQRSMQPQNAIQHIQQNMMQGQLMKQQMAQQEQWQQMANARQQQAELEQQKFEAEQEQLKKQQMFLASQTSQPVSNGATAVNNIPVSNAPTTNSPNVQNVSMPQGLPQVAPVNNQVAAQAPSPEQENQYTSALNSRYDQVTTALSNPSQFPDMATFDAYKKEQITLLGKLDAINGEKDYSEGFTNPKGQRIGFHNRRNRLEDMSTGQPYTDTVPTGWKPPSVMAQETEKKKTDTKIGQSGYRTKKVNVNGIDYEQEIYTDVDGNQNVTSSRPVLESGFKVNPNKESDEPDVVPLTGGTRDMANPKNWTGDMRKASGFTNRMLMAEKNINNLMGEKADYDPANNANYMYAKGHRWVANKTMSPEDQRYMQSSSDWIRSKLRKESGAVIADEEMASEYATYFPISGDSKEVIGQKRKARMQATRNMQTEASEAWQADSAMGIPSPKTDLDFEKIRRGDLFIDDDGKVYRKQ